VPEQPAILTDIEGTTSSIAFVKEVLFPYARSRIGAYVREHGHDPEVAGAVAALTALLRDEGGLRTTAPHALDLALDRLIDEDRKLTPLKLLQGRIWAAGYADGSLVGHVYPDAVRQLRAWHAQGVALYVYSSGSVPAQKLLFAHTAYGDLTPLFSDYFDTRVGPKHDAASYRAIAAALARPAGELLFLSDSAPELDAAASAGLRVCQLVRPEEPSVEHDPRSTHPGARSFDDVLP
jgi:enolase-phosphatase E1